MKTNNNCFEILYMIFMILATVIIWAVAFVYWRLS
jgi:hypothetical protein